MLSQLGGLVAVVLAGISLLPQEGATVLTTFPGDSAVGHKQVPDNVGAVGPAHVVDFTSENFVVHDKKTGKVLLKKSQEQFWQDLGFPHIWSNDPRILYDPLSGRFIATVAHDKVHELFLAVSTSSDPTERWRGVKTPFQSPDFGFRMGVDKNGFYGCWWNHNPDTHVMMNCCALAKSDLLAADGPDLSRVQIFRNLEVESFPETDLNPNKPPDAPEILLCHEFARTSFNKLYMYKITWTGKDAAITKVQEIPLGRTYFCPNGGSHQNEAIQPAPGGHLRADEARRTCSVYASGESVFTCNGAKQSLEARCGIFWCEVRVKDGAVLQEGLIDDPERDYLVPSLAVDGDGNIGIGCTRTSAEEFPSACVISRSPSSPKNSMGPPVISVKGTGIYTPLAPPRFAIGWGNYNSTCIDPTDPTILWTYQEYAGSGTPGQFSTCWTAFRVKPGGK